MTNPALVPRIKGGFDREEWMRRYGAELMALGYKPYAVEGMADAAWDEADEDMTPSDAVDEEVAASGY